MTQLNDQAAYTLSMPFAESKDQSTSVVLQKQAVVWLAHHNQLRMAAHHQATHTFAPQLLRCFTQHQLMRQCCAVLLRLVICIPVFPNQATTST
jgi:hypothetical protein